MPSLARVERDMAIGHSLAALASVRSEEATERNLSLRSRRAPRLWNGLSSSPGFVTYQSMRLSPAETLRRMPKRASHSRADGSALFFKTEHRALSISGFGILYQSRVINFSKSKFGFPGPILNSEAISPDRSPLGHAKQRRPISPRLRRARGGAEAHSTLCNEAPRGRKRSPGERGAARSQAQIPFCRFVRSVDASLRASERS